MKKTHLFRHQRYSHPNRTIAGKSFRAVSASFSVFQFRRSKYRKQRHPNDPALRLIRRIALSLTFASSRSIPTHTRCTLIQTHCSFSDSRRPIGKAAGPNLVPNPFKFSPMIKKLLLSLSAVFCMTAASAQTQTVKGRVVDENNAPVIGATVVVKNRPTIGTSTDVKGEFALQGVPKGGGGETPNLLCRLQNPGC